ncbi:MAG: PAS domain S-box protein [Parafilimonas sp.]
MFSEETYNPHGFQPLTGEKSYRNILDYMLEGVQILNFDWQYIYVNDVVLKQSKLSREDLLGFTMPQRYPGVEKTELWKILKRCMNTRKSEQFENEFIYADNTISYFQLRIQPCPEGLLILSVDITEYNNNEKRFRVLIEKSQDMKTLSSKDGDILYCSPSITKVLGYTTDEYLQKNVLDMVHPDDVASFLLKRKNIFEVPGSSFHYEHRVKHKSGHWIWREGTITNLLNEPGIFAIVSNFRDISERKLAEQQREFEQNNLNALINNTQDLMWSIGKDFSLITYNRAFETLMNFLTSGTIKKGDDIRKLNIPQERLQLMKFFYQRALKGEIFTEIQHITEPVEIYNEISFYPIYKNNVVIGTACHARDVTSRIRFEQQIKNSEIFNRGVIDSLNAHIAVVDSKGVVITVNAAWKKFADANGKDRLQNSSVGANYFEVCKKLADAGDETVMQVLTGIMNVLHKKEEIFNLEYTCSTTEKQLWFSMQVMRFESDDTMLVISVHDISERKKAELERADIFNSLLQRNKDLEQFSYIVSHNLRAPVANILGTANIIDNPGLSVSDKELLVKGVGESAKKLDEVIYDLNYILKLRQVKEETKEKVCFSKLVKEITYNIHHLIDPNNVIIQYDFSAIDEWRTSKEYLYSIFYNLITNSIKFRKPNIQTIIRIGSTCKDELLELSFADNGTGINLKKRGGQVFGIYKRFHLESEGRGIGLFLVKTQVEALGGKITIASEENIGTKFTITFIL